MASTRTMTIETTGAIGKGDTELLLFEALAARLDLSFFAMDLLRRGRHVFCARHASGPTVLEGIRKLRLKLLGARIEALEFPRAIFSESILSGPQKASILAKAWIRNPVLTIEYPVIA